MDSGELCFETQIQVRLDVGFLFVTRSKIHT